MRAAPILLTALLLASNAYADKAPDELKSLIYNSENTTQDHTAKTDTARLSALKEEAMRIGIQGGMAHQTKYIIANLEQHEHELDTVYNFKSLIALGSANTPVSNLMMPIIEKATDLVELDNNAETLNVSGTLYKIIKPARLITATPRWQDYLVYQTNPVQEVDPTLQPKTGLEKKLWQESMLAGWRIGQEQANEEMAIRMRKLQRDYTGVLLYLTLYAEGRVSAPYVALSRNSIRGNANEIAIDNKLYRITKHSELNNNIDTWQLIEELDDVTDL